MKYSPAMRYFGWISLSILLFASILSEANAQKRSGNQSLAVKLMQRVNQRGNIRVLSAFEDVVKKPTESTVELVRDKNRIAMGTIVGTEGEILTKASQVVEVRIDGKDTPLVCRLASGDQYEASIISVNEEYDLALLKIEAKDLVAAKFNLQDEPLVGSILASPSLGEHPLGIGVMSSASRKIRQSRPMIGIQLAQQAEGAIVESIVKDSAADKARLKVDDVIVQINDKKIENYMMLIRTVQEYRPGDIIRLLVKRGEDQLDVLCTLGEYLNGPNQARHQFQNKLGGNLSNRRTGFPVALQHDTFLKPEDCGGPLVDLDGNVIGINIARAGRVASYAIPSKQIPKLISELKSAAKVNEVSTSSK